MGHWKGELRHMPTKSCRQVGTSCPPLPPPAPLCQGLPLAETALLTAVAHSQQHIIAAKEKKHSVCGAFSCHLF